MILSGNRNWQTAGIYSLLAVTLLIGMLHLEHSVWHDEGLTWRIVQGANWSDVSRSAMTQKPMPPVYFILTQFSWRWLGNEAGLRLISFLFGLGALGLAFVLFSRWAGRTAAVATAGFMAATPGVFFYFVDANPYSLLIFTVLLSLLALDRAMEHNRKFDWFLYWLALIFGLSIHTIFIFYAAAQWLVPLFRSVHKLRSRPGSRAIPVKLLAASVSRFGAVVLATLLPWLAWVLFYFQMDGYRNPLNFGRLLEMDTLFCFAGMIPGPLAYGHWIQWIAFPVLLVSGVIRIWKFHREKLVEWLLLWTVPVLLITVFVRLTQAFIGYRYGLGVFPLTCMIIVSGAGIGLALPEDRLFPSIGKKRFIPQFLFAAYLLAGFGRLVLGGGDLFLYQDWKQTAAYLSRHVAPRDVLWVPGERLAYPLRFYSSSLQLPTIAWPEKREIEYLLNDLNRIGYSARQGGYRVWVVSPDFTNSNLWIESKTRSPQSGRRQIFDRVYSALPHRSPYHLKVVQEYRRIRIMRLE